MNEGSYRFKLGDFECVSLSDGHHNYPIKDLFANVPEESVQEVLHSRNLPTDHVNTPYTYLYVYTGDHRLLIDMGAGDLFPTTGKLPQNMKAAGLDLASIDSVAITHAHPDHIGGTLDNVGRPVFSNALYYISKREWDYWFSEEALKTAGAPDWFPAELFVNHARGALEPIKDRVKLVEFSDHESEIIPGVRAITTPGHTPGHVAFSVSSGGEKLYYIGDVVIYPLHLEHPDWIPIFDILPEEADPSKHDIFNRAADEKAWVVGQHFPPFPSLGHVSKKGSGWEWQPIETDS